jgi:hypothetical protein
MFQLTLNFKTLEELTSAIALLSGTSAKAISTLSDNDQARLRGDALVVPPGKETKAPTAAETKAAAKAAAKAIADAAAAAAETDETDPLDEGTTDDDALGESEALTHDDVKKLLIEVRGAFPKDATIISTIVKEKGKQAKISDVDEALLPVVAAHCRELLAKAAKAKK